MAAENGGFWGLFSASLPPLPNTLLPPINFSVSCFSLGMSSSRPRTTGTRQPMLIDHFDLVTFLITTLRHSGPVFTVQREPLQGLREKGLGTDYQDLPRSRQRSPCPLRQWPSRPNWTGPSAIASRRRYFQKSVVIRQLHHQRAAPGRRPPIFPLIRTFLGNVGELVRRSTLKSRNDHFPSSRISAVSKSSCYRRGYTSRCPLIPVEDKHRITRLSLSQCTQRLVLKTTLRFLR
jgi:hypothetical protein